MNINKQEEKTAGLQEGVNGTPARGRTQERYETTTIKKEAKMTKMKRRAQHKSSLARK